MAGRKPRIPWFLLVGKEAEIQRGDMIHLQVVRGAKTVVLISDSEDVSLSNASSLEASE